MSRKSIVVVLSEAERVRSEQWVRAGSTPRQVVLRARIILAAGQGQTDWQIGQTLKVQRRTAALWRRRMRAQGLGDCFWPRAQSPMWRGVRGEHRDRHPANQAGGGHALEPPDLGPGTRCQHEHHSTGLAGTPAQAASGQVFLKFLRRLDGEFPGTVTPHRILDNYGTHGHERMRQWLAKHPRFVLHFIPTNSSWLNLVERWFAELSQKTVRRGVFRSVQELERSIHNFLNAWNAQPTPFVWTASLEKILEKVARCRRRLEQVQPGCTQSKRSAI